MALGAIGTGLYWVCTSQWEYAFYAGCVVLFWWGIAQKRIRRFRRLHIEALNKAFTSSDLPVPVLTERSGYGFPSITLTFPTEEDIKRANGLGCISAFKQSMQQLYEHVGSDENPYDADRAVWATYVGWQPC